MIAQGVQNFLPHTPVYWKYKGQCGRSLTVLGRDPASDGPNGVKKARAGPMAKKSRNRVGRYRCRTHADLGRELKGVLWRRTWTTPGGRRSRTRGRGLLYDRLRRLVRGRTAIRRKIGRRNELDTISDL